MNDAMNETRNMLASMIETCEELDQKPVFQQDEDAELTKQVQEGKRIFETQFGFNFKKPQVPSKRNTNLGLQSPGRESDISRISAAGSSAVGMSLISSQFTGFSQSQESSLNVDTKPSDLLLLFKHTKLCTAVFRKRVARMGAQENIFSLELFLAAQRLGGIDEETGEYSVLRAFRKECQDTALAYGTMSATPCFVGAFNHNEYVAECQEQERKVKDEKERLTPRTRNKIVMRFDKNVTVHEELDASQVNSQAVTGKENNLLRNALRKQCADNKVKEVNLIDFFVNKESVFESMKNIFETSFGVRDGHIALDTGTSGSFVDMKVAPCAVKKKKDTESELDVRSQCVVSFSAKDLRKLFKAAEGENAIERQPNPTEKS